MLATAHLLNESIEDMDLLEENKVINGIKNFFKSSHSRLLELSKEKTVIEYIKLAEKIFMTQKASSQEKQRLEQLLSDQHVKAYMEAIQATKGRAGAVAGGMSGGYLGFLAGGITVGVKTSPGWGATPGGPIILGALAGALAIGYLGAKTMSKFTRYLARLEASDDVRAVAHGGVRRGEDVNMRNVPAFKR